MNDGTKLFLIFLIIILVVGGLVTFVVGGFLLSQGEGELDGESFFSGGEMVKVAFRPIDEIGNEVDGGLLEITNANRTFIRYVNFLKGWNVIELNNETRYILGFSSLNHYFRKHNVGLEGDRNQEFVMRRVADDLSLSSNMRLYGGENSYVFNLSTDLSFVQPVVCFRWSSNIIDITGSSYEDDRVPLVSSGGPDRLSLYHFDKCLKIPGINQGSSSLFRLNIKADELTEHDSVKMLFIDSDRLFDKDRRNWYFTMSDVNGFDWKTPDIEFIFNTNGITRVVELDDIEDGWGMFE